MLWLISPTQDWELSQLGRDVLDVVLKMVSRHYATLRPDSIVKALKDRLGDGQQDAHEVWRFPFMHSIVMTSC